jgi:hypothetical protein
MGFPKGIDRTNQPTIFWTPLVPNLIFGPNFWPFPRIQR